MSLMALADTIATTSTDLKDSQGKSKGTAGEKQYKKHIFQIDSTAVDKCPIPQYTSIII